MRPASRRSVPASGSSSWSRATPSAVDQVLGDPTASRSRPPDGTASRSSCYGRSPVCRGRPGHARRLRRYTTSETTRSPPCSSTPRSERRSGSPPGSAGAAERIHGGAQQQKDVRDRRAPARRRRRDHPAQVGERAGEARGRGKGGPRTWPERAFVTLAAPAVAAASTPNSAVSIVAAANWRRRERHSGGEMAVRRARRMSSPSPHADHVLVAAGEAGGGLRMARRRIGTHRDGMLSANFVALSSSSGTSLGGRPRGPHLAHRLEQLARGRYRAASALLRSRRRCGSTCRHDTLLSRRRARGRSRRRANSSPPAPTSIWAGAASICMKRLDGELGSIGAADRRTSRRSIPNGVVDDPERTLFVLDARSMPRSAPPTSPSAPLAHLLATRLARLWAIAEGRAEAHLRAYRLDLARTR